MRNALCAFVSVFDAFTHTRSSFFVRSNAFFGACSPKKERICTLND